jgi:hypothetical protein
VGIVTPGPRIQAIQTNTVTYLDGVPQLPPNAGSDTERRDTWSPAAQLA